MPDGDKNSVEVHVATIPALLVMKGFALQQRFKLKDAYDIWYCIRYYPGGPEMLAEQCRPLLADEVAREGFAQVARKFRSDDDFGPVNVRKFLESSGLLGGMTPQQAAVDAYLQVRAWQRALGVPEGG